MKKDWLFPHRYRQIGWFLFIPSALLGLSAMYGDAVGRSLVIPFMDSRIFDSFSDEIAAMGVLVGLLFIAFAREKMEDEMIRQLRLESLQWSVYANYFLLALAIAFIYNEAFFAVLVYNMFTILIVFIVRFRWSLKRIGQAGEVAPMKNRVKVARAEHDLSQADLADRIGVSRQTINSIETGRYIPSTVLALKIAQTFDKPLETLFSLDETD